MPDIETLKTIMELMAAFVAILTALYVVHIARKDRDNFRTFLESHDRKLEGIEARLQALEGRAPARESQTPAA